MSFCFFGRNWTNNTSGACSAHGEGRICGDTFNSGRS